MVQLYLDGVEIITSPNQTINISKENPYFTMSDSYSLNVEVPLDIPQNAKFFGNVNRKDSRKYFKTYDALMTSNVGVLIKGMARITKSTELVVKLQLTSGISAVKMVASIADAYIDTLDLGRTATGKMPSTEKRLDEGEYYDAGNMSFFEPEGHPPMHCVGVPFYDTANDLCVNMCDFVYNGGQGGLEIFLGRRYVSTCPRFIDVLTNVFSMLGFTLDTSSLNDAIENIYIITGIHSSEVAAKLPHWTVSKFIEEVQNFLACTFVADGRTVKIVPMAGYADGHTVEISPVESFEVDYSEKEETKGIINCNVEYAMDANNDEVVDDTIINAAIARQSFLNYELAAASFDINPDDYTRRRTIYEVDGAMYVGWDDGLRRIGPFNPLKRYKDADTVRLSICPVKMLEGYEHVISGGTEQENAITLNIPTVENPLPVKERNFVGWTPENNVQPSLQELLSGESDNNESDGKSDIMPVMFVGGYRKAVRLSLILTQSGKRQYANVDTEVSLGFTDWRYKAEEGMTREKWSLSLQNLKDCDFCIGQLHQLPFQTNRKCRQQMKFMMKSIPSATDIFVVRNRKYACEKIEIPIDNGEVSPLMTGCFYELIE